MVPGSDPVASWSTVTEPVLVVGRGARANAINTDACTKAGIRLVHRRSGGGPVLWDAGLLALDVVLPAEHPLADRDVTRAYAWIGAALAQAVRALGIPATSIPLPDARAAQARTDPASLLAARACFGGISPFEVVGPDGGKLVGLSQVRRHEGTIFQCGIALEFDAATLARLLAVDPADAAALTDALGARARGLRASRPELTNRTVIAAVEDALVDQLDIGMSPGHLTAPEAARQDALALTLTAP
jgi:lipoate-protein ligase A